MVAILLEDDQHSREVLSAMLNQLGFTTVLAATSIDEAEYFFSQKKGQVRLIVSSDTSGEGPDLPLSRMVIQNRSLDMAPFVLLTNDWRPAGLSRFRTRLSRVDDVLARPFSISDLKGSLSSAHQRRARLRSSLIVFGTQHSELIERSVFSGSDDFHWKTIIKIQDVQALKKTMEDHPFYIGGILVEPAKNNLELLSWINQFKKTNVGSYTPIGVLSTQAEQILPFRTSADLFFNEESDWTQVLTILSKRATLHWEMKLALQEIRQLIKANQVKQAMKELLLALEHDDNRWELLELSGVLRGKGGKSATAIHDLRKALSTQPCSPFAYLTMMELITGEQKQKIIQEALQYCPQHPRIRAIYEASAP